MWFVWWCLGILLLLQAVPVVLLARRLLQLDLQKSRRTPVEEAQLPGHLAPVFARVRAELERVGFRLAAWTQLEGMTRYRSGPGWGAVLLDDSGTVAEVDTHVVPEPARPLSVSFTTAFADGGALVTLNGEAWSMLGAPPRTELHDAFSPNVAAQLESHRRRLSELAPPRTTVATTLEAYLPFADGQVRALLRGLDDEKALVANGDGSYRLTLRAALRWGLRLRRSARAARRGFARMVPAVAEERPPLPAQLEIEAFLRQRELQDKAMSRDAKAWLFAGSLALFATVLLPLLPPRTVGLLALVLLVHELGHLAAMRALGYRDTTVFFLPFFGAAVTGDGSRASAWQRAVVSLAGPLPGLVAGGVLLLVLPTDPQRLAWATELGWLLLLVNALNLLPIAPLDGGQLVNELVFSRRRWAEVLFRGGSALLLVAAGAWLVEPLLLALGGLGLLTLPATWRRVRLIQALREVPAGDERSLLHASFDWLRVEAPRSSFSQRAALVQSVRRAGLVATAPLPTTVVTLVVWLSAVAFAPAVFWVRRDTERRAAVAKARAVDGAGVVPATRDAPPTSAATP